MADRRSELLNLPIPDEENLTNAEFVRLRDALILVDASLGQVITDVAGKAASAHNHQVADIDGLRAELDQLNTDIQAVGTISLNDLEDVNASSGQSGMVLLNVAGTWQAAVLSAANVSHGAGSVEGKFTSLDTALAGKAGTSHSHTIAQVNGLEAALQAKLGAGDKASDSGLFDGLTSEQFLRADANTNATGQVSFSAGLTTNGKDIVTDNGAFIANDSDGPFANRSGTNIDHIWHDDSANAWHFVSDAAYKTNGNSRLFAANFRVTGEALDIENQFIGKGQSWRSVSRSYNTSYRNTHNKSMMVCVTQTGSGSTAGNNRMRLQVSSNNSSWVDVGWSNDNNNWGGCVSAIIPPGWYYRVPDNQVAMWREMY
ncbi:hypothetical protein [Roseibium sp.]|uniref:hypothetical protein n=1 Tax=Roseibium sp. TaxID=1936156 RepID=UPI003BAC8553